MSALCTEKIIKNNIEVIKQLMTILENDAFISKEDCEKYIADFGGLNLNCQKPQF